MSIEQRNEWVERTLGSLEGIQRAEANPYLYTRITERLKQRTATFAKPRLIWQLALGFCFIIGLNIWGGFRYLQSQQTTGGPVQSVAEEYFGGTTIAY